MGIKASACVIASIALLSIDIYSENLDGIRKKMSIFSAPIQRFVDWPIQKFGLTIESIISYQSILDSNAKLHQEIMLLRSKIQKMTVIKNENLQLRALLQSSKMLTTSSILIAQMMAISSQKYVLQYTVNKGIVDGVYDGEVVLDSQGVFGQISKAGNNTSRILLITSHQNAVPVQNARTNIRGIAKGNGARGTLSLINTPTNSDILLGDLFYTSGLGNKYPYGYPVGVVSKVNHNTGNGFAEIELLPSSRLHSSNLLLLLDPKVPQEQRNSNVPGK